MTSLLAPTVMPHWKRCDSQHEAIMLPSHICVLVMVADSVVGKRCEMDDIVYAHVDSRYVAADYQQRGWLVQRIGNVVRLVRRPQ